MSPFTRREFIRTGSLAVLGVAAAACGSGNGTKNDATPAGTLNDIIASRQTKLNVITVGTELIPQRSERVAVALIDPVKEAPLQRATARAWVARTRTEKALGPFPLTFRSDGLPSDKVIYDTTITFPAPGAWLCLVEATAPGESTAVLGGAELQVGIRNAMPKIGDPCPVVPTPTTTDARGVDPICTRKPPCSMHDTSLDVALKNGEPTVVVIATPAYCQSQLCGPEVDLLEEVKRGYAGTVNFIHIEVLKNDDADTVAAFSPLSPAAMAFKLEEEPVIYCVGTNGIIESRLLGPVDRTNIDDATRALLS